MTLWQDLKLGFRMLCKRPSVTLFAVLALALGIGANSVIFSMVNALLLTPLPLPNPDRIMRVEEKRVGTDFTSGISGRNYLDCKERATCFERISLITTESYNLAGWGEPIRVPAYRITTDMLRAADTPMAKGRTFLPEEGEPGAERVAVLNYGFWKEHFGEDESVLGKEIFLNEESYTVVGIVSPSLGLFDTEGRLWIPLTKDSLQAEGRDNRHYTAIGGLKEGVSAAQAQAELAAIGRQLQKEYPDANKEWEIQVEPIIQKLVRQIRTLVLILHGAVGFLLLIACSNVASLLLANAGTRSKEMAVRTALGAGKGRILRQMLIENVLLSLAGGVCGLLITLWGIELIRYLLPPVFSDFLTREGINGSLLAFTLVLSVLTGLLFGLVPALQSMRFNLNDILKDSGRSGGFSRGRHRLLKALVVGEVALSLVLLLGAGLMANSFLHLQRESPGFRTRELLTFSVFMPVQKYEEQDKRRFFQEAVQRISSLPGVEGTAAANVVPFTSGVSVQFRIEGKELPPDQRGLYAQLRNVNLDYFRVFQIPLLRGEPFSDRDEDPSARTVVVDQELVERYFPGEDPLGRTIRVPEWDNAEFRIAGVVGKVKSFGFRNDFDPTIYVPFLRQPADSASFALATKTTKTGRAALLAAVRSEIAAVDPHLPVDRVSTMEELIDGSMQFEKFIAVFLGIFSFVALFLSAVGIYGIISFTVNQQTHDIGVRMALGAEWRNVLGMVIRRGMALTGAGILIGLAGSLAVLRILAGQLYGIGAYDPMTFLYVVLFFTAVALAACYFPARRAAKVDPVVALRSE